MVKANADIRAELKNKKVPVYAIADVMGVHENTVFRRLRFELSAEEKQTFRRIIDELSEQNEAANN